MNGLVKRYIDLFKAAFTHWNERAAAQMGAALAFYSVLSLAPLLILVVGICALVFGTSGAQAQILDQFRAMVGGDGAQVIEGVLKSAQKPTTGILASIVGLGTLLFGASGVFVELRADLNKLWDVQGPAVQSGIWSFVRDRFLSFGMVLGIGFLLLVSLIVSAGLGAAGKYFQNLGVLPPVVWESVNFTVSLAVVAGLFTMILRFVPDVRLPWRDVAGGAVLTALLFTLGKTLIGVYLGKAGVGSAYGAAGSLVVLVVWIYYSAQIFFFGAAFTMVYAQSHGWQPRPGVQQAAPAAAVTARPAAAVDEAARERPVKPRSVWRKLAGAGLILAAMVSKGSTRRRV